MSNGANFSLGKVAIVGAGLVGSTTAFSLLMNGICSEIALIDTNKTRAEGEALDLDHCMQFANLTTIIAGDSFELVAGADVVVITAGVGQKPGESRTDLLQKNSEVIRDIIPLITKYNTTCVLLVVTNPLDVMTYLTWKLSGFSSCNVFGTGTVLDTARLRFMIGEQFQVSPKDVTAYMLGEHGETAFAWWSNAAIGGVPLAQFSAFNDQSLVEMQLKTRAAAADIIAKKGATYYAIALSIVNIVRAILLDQPRVFSVSHLLHNSFGLGDVCLSLPTIIRKSVLCEMLPAHFNALEQQALQMSAEKISQDIQTALKYV